MGTAQAYPVTLLFEEASLPINTFADPFLKMGKKRGRGDATATWERGITCALDVRGPREGCYTSLCPCMWNWEIAHDLKPYKAGGTNFFSSNINLE